MITCVVDYQIDPTKIVAFEQFALRWIELVNEHGGRITATTYLLRRCGRSRNSRWLRSRNSAVGGSVLMFYSLAAVGVEVARPGRLLGR